MEFQFGEILTLILCAVAAAYLVASRRPIRSLRALRPLVVPFFLMTVAWTMTVLESPLSDDGAWTISFGEESADVAAARGLLSETLNLIEHLAYTTAAIWLLVVLWRAFQTPREAIP